MKIQLYKKAVLLLPFLLLQLGVFGQQKAQFTQYMTNMQYINPAYPGTSGRFSIMTLDRMQWAGFDGAPNTLALMLTSPVPYTNLGLGATILNDRIGSLSETGAYFDVAYNVRLKGDIRLSLGAKAGFNFMQANLSDIALTDPNDPAFVNSEKATEFMPNIGGGAYLYAPKFYVGISTPELYNHKADVASVTGDQKRHMYFIGGYLLPLSPRVLFKPSGSIKLVPNAPPSFELNASFIFNETIWLGGMSRIGDSFGVIAQYQITDFFRIGYAFDMAITPMANYNYGTHEILLRYEIPYKNIKIKTPRFF